MSKRRLVGLVVVMSALGACSSDGAGAQSDAGGGGLADARTGVDVGSNGGSLDGGGATGGDGGTTSGTLTDGTFRYGVNMGHRNASWGDDITGHLSAQAGATSARLKLPEYHLDRWGYDIESSDMASYARDGMSRHVAFIGGPTRPHSTMPASEPDWRLDEFSPKDLYQPIFLGDGSVNPANTYAAYVERMVRTYRERIEVWEVWNEPDWVSDYRVVAAWRTEPPRPADLAHWNDTVFAYIRMLRITWEVARKVDPGAHVSVGGLGYANFLRAILRYTDNPAGGAVSAEYPSTGGAYFDVTSLHYYPIYTPGSSDGAADGLLAHRREFDAVFTEAGLAVRPVIYTESGAPREVRDMRPGGVEYARSYLLKAMTLAHDAGIARIDWFALTDSAAAGAGDSYAHMGLFEDTSGLQSMEQARRTPTGTAYRTLSTLLAGARTDHAATEALGLTAAIRGAAFRRADGKRVYVLWARSPATGESATAEVDLPAAGPWTAHAWDFAVTNATQTITPSGGRVRVPLSGSPQIFVE